MFKKGKKTANRKDELQWREEWDVRETTMQTPRSVKKEREEVPMVRQQAVPLQPMKG